MSLFGVTEPTGSHVATLERAAREANGLVIEHGAGLYSTPLLARLGCRVLCCESNPAWREWAAWIYREQGEVTDSLAHVIIRLPDAALVFIDGPSNERAQLIEACFGARVPVIVAHDTAPRVFKEYGWRAEHFTPSGYAVEHDDASAKYRTTVWRR